MESVKIYLLDKTKGDVQYGLNWGQRENREPNQAYLQLEPDIYKGDFFPKKGKYFVVDTDDHTTLIFNRAQKTADGCALHTPESNSIIGLYLRKRLGITNGVEITRDAILNYGKLDIDVFKVDDLHYLLDFSKDWKTKDTRYLFEQYLLIHKHTDNWKETQKLSNNISDYSNQLLRSAVIDKEIFATDVFEQLIDILSQQTDKTQYPAISLFIEFLKSDFFKHHYGELETSHQIIVYGAPGTGKSYKIKERLDGVSKENIFRTTFHPDSDYSTFVGSYKPTMASIKEQLYSKDELINKLNELRKQGITRSPHKFSAKYWRSLKQLTPADRSDILAACGMSDNYIVEFNKGIAVGEELLKGTTESQIIYRFVPQSFLNAYIQAYKKPEEKVYLIIEEINRGNCAQIFGDLFQLLDRDSNGVSEYSIKADADLKSFLEEELGKDNAGIREGELCLPSNLYIYATMNTSDQSLFPIDSAFKRRWDWEYEPIKYKNTNWVINIQGNKYSWVSFQREINKRILEATNSEDKMLGDYFVNPYDEVITDKMLLNKILFYLWNDVCKDGEGDIFRTSEENTVSFSDLYGDEGKQKLLDMMNYLSVLEIDDVVEIDADEDTDNSGNKEHLKVVFPDGTELYSRNSVKTFVDTISKIGPEKVESVGIIMSGFDLVSKHQITAEEDPSNYRRSQKRLDNGYYVITKSSNSTKQKQLLEINNTLSLGLTITLE